MGMLARWFDRAVPVGEGGRARRRACVGRPCTCSRGSGVDEGRGRATGGMKGRAVLAVRRGLERAGTGFL